MVYLNYLTSVPTSLSDCKSTKLNSIITFKNSCIDELNSLWVTTFTWIPNDIKIPCQTPWLLPPWHLFFGFVHKPSLRLSSLGPFAHYMPIGNCPLILYIIQDARQRTSPLKASIFLTPYPNSNMPHAICTTSNDTKSVIVQDWSYTP